MEEQNRVPEQKMLAANPETEEYMKWRDQEKFTIVELIPRSMIISLTTYPDRVS